MYQRKNLDENKTVEVRTKIGEALVRATKELGDVTPKYKNLLLNAFFSAASDPEDLVRASSLSNLGEVCQNIKFSLGPIAGELMMHLEASARDKAVEVKYFHSIRDIKIGSNTTSLEMSLSTVPYEVSKL